MKTLKLQETRFLKNVIAPIFLAFLFLAIRMYITRSIHYSFLVWNLFLAAVPLAISYIITYSKLWQNRIVFISLFLSWLLFLPNAPYIITDFIHLEHWSQMPLWFDFILIGLFAWAGLLMAFKSTYLIYQSLKPTKLLSLTVKSMLNPQALLFSFCFSIFLISTYSLYVKFARIAD